MNQYIAILRGINVGGNRKIKMADLKELFAGMSFTEISAYIQSGNVLFSSAKEEDSVALGDKLEQAIADTFGFAVPVIVRTVEELQQAIATNPFYASPDSDIERLHLTFLKTAPAPAQLAVINQINHLPDKFNIIGNHAFVYCSGRYSESKLTNSFFEKKLKVPATTRNWKTVLKLVDLSLGK
ncbi:DUF1697 domain-containing protein [Prolixibacter denitrificans]|uniref:Uncharacterized protein (DUF1697 family) n=1 Tax=Prolixibacter denitrificans TaxID=1541063 RepID=A0A2P8C984_9BACT|nr:DUF1697 domain-containing protein [Prolixibacter denitrificans]PSK81513.1 uncharacterized protein (DUF1697 family) [Prolixibacter denitrificans]GET21019.1 hypothetical protein JCM18694_12650 [Prolixibacter denitrificans]